MPPPRRCGILPHQDSMIALTGVGKTYPLYRTRREIAWDLLFPRRGRSGSFAAVKPISLEVRRGERIGVMGVNGSGKSTLLQMIAGTVTPTSGEVRVNGRVASLLELGSWINSSDTGRENVFTSGYAQGLTRDEIAAKMDDIVAFAEIGDFIDQPVSTYSTGMLMRLAFATSIYQEADILLLDEIFAVGDARFAQKCIAHLRDYVKDKTVILVSHDTNIVTMLCTRAILLDHGSVAADGSPREITERYLKLCYGEKQSVDAASSGDAESLGDTERFAPFGDAESLRVGEDTTFGEGGARLASVCLVVAERFAPFGDAESLRVNKDAIDPSDAVGTPRPQGAASTSTPRPQFRGGERVTLAVRAVATKTLEKPSVGFVVRSPEGVLLWGDSTLPGELADVSDGHSLEATFSFALPRLVNGIYTVGVAVSTGELAVHRVQIWNQAALQFSIAGDWPSGGALFGLPGATHEIRQ